MDVARPVRRFSMSPKLLVPPCVCVALGLAGCDFLWDVFQPEAPVPPRTPTVCIADELELGGQSATLDVRFTLLGPSPEPVDGPDAFVDCVGDGEAWDTIDGEGRHVWVGIVGAGPGIVDGVDNALASGAAMSLHVATTRGDGPGTDVFALSFADTGLPAVAFQRNGDITLADAGVVGVDAGGIPLVSSDDCGLFEFPDVMFIGGEADLIDEAAEPDPETGERPVLVPGRTILGMDQSGAVFVDGEVVDVFTGVVFARSAADCPDPPPTGRFMNWTALLRFE